MSQLTGSFTKRVIGNASSDKTEQTLAAIHLALKSGNLLSSHVEESVDFVGNTVLSITTTIKKDIAFGSVADLIRECRTIDLRESFKVAAQMDLK